MPRSVTYTALANVPLVNPGDDLADILIHAIEGAQMSLLNGDVVVIAQKIVSKAEGRYVDLNSVTPSRKAIRLARVVGKDARYIEVVLSESSEVLKADANVLIVVHRLGFVMANAGIDESNIEHAEGCRRVLLLPVDPDQACVRIKERFDRHFNASVGVLMNDSFGRPWRNGVVGVAIGAAGVPSLQSAVGRVDLFGRRMQVTEIAVADELAAGASSLMGQANEGTPAVHVRGFSIDAPITNAQALIRPKERDLFR